MSSTSKGQQYGQKGFVQEALSTPVDTNADSHIHPQPELYSATSPEVLPKARPEPVLSDSALLDFIRDFVRSKKPSDVLSIDAFQIVVLLLFRANDHEVYHSQQTMAQYLACDVQTIAASQKRLTSAKIDWLYRRSRKGRTSLFSVKADNLSTDNPLKVNVTPEAGQLAGAYRLALQRAGRKRFQKHWVKNQLLHAQRIINACNGDAQSAANMIIFALSHQSFRKTVLKGLYNVCGIWPRIERAYASSGAKRLAQQQQQSQQRQTVPVPVPVQQPVKKDVQEPVQEVAQTPLQEPQKVKQGETIQMAQESPVRTSQAQQQAPQPSKMKRVQPIPTPKPSPQQTQQWLKDQLEKARQGTGDALREQGRLQQEWENASPEQQAALQTKLTAANTQVGMCYKLEQRTEANLKQHNSNTARTATRKERSTDGSNKRRDNDKCNERGSTAIERNVAVAFSDRRMPDAATVCFLVAHARAGNHSQGPYPTDFKVQKLRKEADN